MIMQLAQEHVHQFYAHKYSGVQALKKYKCTCSHSGTEKSITGFVGWNMPNKIPLTTMYHLCDIVGF